MSQSGKVRIIVRSRRVPVGTTVVRAPMFTSTGVLVGTRTERVVKYESRLDEEYVRAIKEGKRLSCSLSLDLEVVDSSRAGPLGRLLYAFGRGRSTRPYLTVAPLASEDAGLAEPSQIRG